ncbi:MAG: hypothetical protein AB7E05_16625, partial [Sphingobium sp.]
DNLSLPSYHYKGETQSSMSATKQGANHWASTASVNGHIWGWPPTVNPDVRKNANFLRKWQKFVIFL